MSRILVTGADGFVGRKLCQLFMKLGYIVRASVRKKNFSNDNIGHETIAVGDIGFETFWHGALKNVDHVVHLAARVHVTPKQDCDSLSAYRQVNTIATEKLACAAYESGVHRFIYISSIKVNGDTIDHNCSGGGFTETDNVYPHGPYAISKWEAEMALHKISHKTGLEVVIIRPPLVYGPGVKANFYEMMDWVFKGIPLPLGRIQNRRSFLAIDNLTDLIATCVEHPLSTNQIFLASDGEDLSTTELLRRLAKYMGKPSRLIPVPQGCLEFGFKIIGREDLRQKICGSLYVNINKAINRLGWQPPSSVESALKESVCHYLESMI